LFHGGAFVFGDLDSEHQRCVHLSANAGAIVVNVDYRLAPEHPFPAGVEDCFAALQWTAENAHSLGIDPKRIAVAGGSAGGALAAAVALMARDRGGPRVAYQMLLYPVIDDRMNTPSMVQGQGLPVWDAGRTRKMWQLYLQTEQPRENVSHYAAPGRCENLSELPPAYILTAEHDPMRDEGMLYAMRLLRAGVSTELYQMPGTVHGFDLLGPSGVASRALDHQAAALRHFNESLQA
jgi:acetyl esterase/lipase